MTLPFSVFSRGIVQVHPSLLCNLSCRHCYSTSGPRQRGALPIDMVLRCLEDCAELGYRVVAVSGGEPLLYPDLARLLRGARELGLRTSVTSNGTLLTRRRLEGMRDHLDVLAVSLDGPPELHDRIRGAPGAFERLEAGLVEIRRLEIQFGLVYTVGESSWRHLSWAGEFARAQGARLLQLHVLELFGRAETEMAGEHPGEEVLLRTYLLAAALRVLYRDILTVQLDLLHRDEAPTTACDRERPPGVTDAVGSEPGPPDGLSVLCLEEDGTLVPATYGLSRRYAVCDVTRERVRTAWPTFVSERWPAFVEHCGRVWTGFQASDRALINWHEALVTADRAPA